MFIHDPAVSANVERLIDRADLVSFDVFDTLLRRPFLRPVDLFAYLEEKHGLWDFQYERLHAEMQARRANPHKIDITYADIYQFLAADPAHEIEAETNLLYARAEGLELYKLARAKGKKIALLSDMYLPKPVIAKLMAKIGVTYDHIFVSGDDQVANWVGSMFRELLRASKIPPGQILHIGDNLDSDFKEPTRIGIRAIHISNEWPFGSADGFAEPLIKRIAGASWRGSRLAASLRDFAHDQQIESVWSAIGAFLAGPLAHAYAQWISDQANRDGVQCLTFLARDGWLPKVAMDRLRQDLQISYSFINRATVSRALFDRPTPNLIEKIEEFLPLTIFSLLTQYGFDTEQIGRELAAKIDLHTPLRNRRALVKALQELRERSEAFRTEAESARRLLEQHLREAGAFSKPDCFALCDIGWFGNVSDMLASLFPEASQWRFYFFGTGATFKNLALNSRSFFFHLGIPEANQGILFEGIEILEALFTSSQSSALRLVEIEGKIAPLFSNSDKHFPEVAANRVQVVSGAEAFLDFYAKPHNLVLGGLDRHVIYQLIAQAVRPDHPELLQAFGAIRHQVFPGDAEWKKLGFENARFLSTVIRWARGRTIKRKGFISWRHGEELAYIQSLSGIKKVIAKRAHRIARSKRKRRARRS
jgi:FMN phosphatase YigB (HAD superfamily)